jgi:regulator of replication initiation timing
MTEDWLAEIKARRARATPGKWRIHATSEYVLESESGQNIASLGGHDHLVQNGDFLANAPADIDKLIAEVDRLTKQIETNFVESEKEFEAWRQKLNQVVKENAVLKVEIEELHAIKAFRSEVVVALQERNKEKAELRAALDKLINGPAPIGRDYMPWAIKVAREALGGAGK